jgi:hypothetical protein
MHATMRQYTGVEQGTFDALLKRRPEVEALLRETPGFAQYDLIRTTGGMTSLTVCQTQAGCEDSNQRVATWIKANMPGLAPTPPQVTGGEDVIRVTAV